MAKVFGISVGQAKSARAELVALGWITPEASNPRAEARWGRAFRINLGWVFGGAKSIPLDPPGRREIETPILNPDPLPEREENPEPLPRAQAGACAGGEGSQSALETLGQIRTEDLADPVRLPEVVKVVARAGLAGSSERDQIRVAALGEHCLRRAKNPAALFVALVRRQAWSFATQGEEDAARRKLAAYREGARRGSSAHRGASTTPPIGRPCPIPTPGQAQPARRSTFVADAPVASPTALGAILGRLGGLGFAAGG